MIEHYITIKENGSHELEIKKSRFITQLVRIDSEEHAKQIIQQTKKEHWKANHNCSAFVLGYTQEIQRSSDDGEPSGTAGMPILDVLKKQELYNTLAIVTRYFGGTKLGAGGLIRAYSTAVSEALNSIGLVKGTLQQEVFVTIDYTQHNALTYFLEQQQITLKATDYSDKVQATLLIDNQKNTWLKEQLTNLFHGQLDYELGQKLFHEADYQKERSN